MRFHVASKARKLFFTREEKPLNGKDPDAGLDLKCKKPVDFGLGCRSFGSKEENFFDSQPWLDSDCEDDFHSVNGEFTPSRGNTPSYQKGTPRLEPLFIDKFYDPKSEISPTGRKKLADLFQETMQGEKGHNQQDAANIRETTHGSKEENFFDSQPWLDSDCEDDFHSVNGEFTPSRGNTPSYQKGAPRLEPLFVDKFSDPKSEISPTGRKKLADLFQETMQGEKGHNQQDAANIRETTHGDASPKSLNGTPYSLGSNSIISSEDTPNGDTSKKKVKIVKMDCCLPSLVHSFNFSDRSLKMSPVCASS